MTAKEQGRGNAIAWLKEDIHKLNEQADHDEVAGDLMVAFQENLLGILEPSEWWAEFSDDYIPDEDNEGLRSTAYVYFSHMDRDVLEIVLWSLHRLSNAELLKLVESIQHFAVYDYDSVLRDDKKDNQ